MPLFVAAALLFGYVGPLNGFWSSDQGVKLIQVQSLLLNKFSSSALIYPGAAIDPDGRVSPLRGQYFQRGKQTYAMFSDAFALMSSVPFFFFGFAGLYLLPLVSLAALSVICVRIARPLLGPRGALLAALALALTSPLLFYSVIFWEHLPATLLVTLALWLALEGYHRNERRWLFGAGIAIGAAVWLRNETVLAAPALIGAVLLTRRSRALRAASWIGVGAIAGVLPLLIYNQITFGAVVGPHVLVAGAAQYQGTSDPLMMRLAWADLLIAPQDEPVLVGSVIIMVMIALITAMWRAYSVANIGFALTVVLAIAIAAIIQMTPRGGLQTTLLITFPAVLLCCFPVVPDERSDRVDAPLILTAFGLTFITLAWLAPLPDGGAQWGPRMLLPALPALTIAGFWRARSWLRQPAAGAAVAGVTAILLFVALLSQYAGLRQLRDFNMANHTLLTTVAQSGAAAIITDTWYGPPLLAPIFYDKRMIFLIDDGADLDYLIERLGAAGFDTVYYVSGRRDAIAADARRWGELAAIGSPVPLAHNLTGQVYRINVPAQSG
ncbi:MAG: glycosyltransferase family 39 protein [Roseiflexus sp.]|nr:glycosyltransferase family 39 protein [Roseiflexus sp.]